jgi:WD40 repeat protein
MGLDGGLGPESKPSITGGAGSKERIMCSPDGARRIGNLPILHVCLLTALSLLLIACGTQTSEKKRAFPFIYSTGNPANDRLIEAAGEGRTDAVETLLNLGADVNAARDGITALWYAAFERHPATVEFLLNRGAKPNVRPATGFSPLMLAVQNNDFATAQILATHGADLELPDPEGYTPLMMAALVGNSSMVKFLLDKGSKVDALSAPLMCVEEHCRKTALALAKDPETMRILKNAGARPPLSVAIEEELRLQNSIRPLTVSDGGEFLALRQGQNRLMIWDWKRGTVKTIMSPERLDSGPAVFSPDNKYLASLNFYTITLFDLVHGSIARKFGGFSAPWTDGVTLSPDNRYLLSWDRDGDRARLWDIASGRTIGILDVRWRHPSASPDFILSSVPQKFTGFFNRKGDVLAVAERLSASGAAGTYLTGRIRMWKLSSITSLQPVNGIAHLRTFVPAYSSKPEADDALSSISLPWPETQVLGLSPHGTYLAVAGPTEIALWDTAQNEVVRRFRAPAGTASYGYFSIAFSEDEKKVFCTLANVTVAWDISSGKVAQRSDGAAGLWSWVSVSGSNAVVFRFDRDDREPISVWDFKTNQKLAEMPQPPAGNAGSQTPTR